MSKQEFKDLPIIIVGDIHSNFIKFFEPLKQANIIKDYEIFENNITYRFTGLEATHNVIYLGDFIHRGEINQMYILDVLVDICNKYPNNVNFVLGNHEVAECNYFLNRNNNDLYQWSIFKDHNICIDCKDYNRIMRKFIDFIKIRHNLLKIEFDDFIISHTIHSKIFPGSLNDCIKASKKWIKAVSAIRPTTPRYPLPSYFVNHEIYHDITLKYKKPTINNYDNYVAEKINFIEKEYPNYVNRIELSNENTSELFDEFIHNELDLKDYYEIFKYDLFGGRAEASISTVITLNYPKLQIVGHDRKNEITYSKEHDLIYCDCESNSWLIYSNDEPLNIDEKYNKIEGLDKFYIYKFD